MVTYDGETEEGKAGLTYGKIGQRLEDASETAGLAETQLGDWEKTESIDTRTNGGGRSLSKRRTREETGDQIDRELSTRKTKEWRRLGQRDQNQRKRGTRKHKGRTQRQGGTQEERRNRGEKRDDI